jgi:hypothetical protein
MAQYSVSGMCEALKAAEMEYCGCSWGGFNLFGDRESIAELQRLMMFQSRFQALEERLLEAEAQLSVCRAALSPSAPREREDGKETK